MMTDVEALNWIALTAIALMLGNAIKLGRDQSVTAYLSMFGALLTLSLFAKLKGWM